MNGTGVNIDRPIKESESPQSAVRSVEICSEYFPPIVLIPLSDCRTKYLIDSEKLPPIVGPKSDTTDYRRLPPIIISPDASSPSGPIFHLIFHPIPRIQRLA